VKVKIIKASKPTYWYVKKIGQVFSVVPCSCPDSYLVKLPKRGYSGMYIDKADCEVVHASD
jgi:hypothetical protein